MQKGVHDTQFWNHWKLGRQGPCLEIAADFIHGGKRQLIKSNKFRFPTLLLDDVVLLYPKIWNNC